MGISRRFFLKSGTLTALAAGVAWGTNAQAFGLQRLPAAPGALVPIEAQQQPSYMFTRATFDPYVGDIFQTAGERGKIVNLTLLSATSYKPSANIKDLAGEPIETDSFALMFQAPRALPSVRSIYQVSHAALGVFDLFLSPVAPAGGVMFYEAVFNHI